MIKRFRFKYALLSLLLFFIPIAVLSGYSNWNSGGTPTVNDTSSQIAVPEEQLPVAYYDSNYFPTVEGAVTAANSAGSAKTVYVIPGRNPTIKKSFTINSNITLCLPYDGTTYFSESASLGGSSRADAYKAASTYRKSLVTVGDSTYSDITITNNGTINIGGIISAGNGGASYNSNTAADYAELTFYGSSSLISNGTVNCYGYITGTNSTGTVSFNNGSSTTLVYSIREHRGGSTFYGMYSNLKSSAFNRWYFAGIRDVTYSFAYGSKIIAYCDLYASSSHNTTTVNILYYNSTSYLISLASGSKLVGKMSTNTSINEMTFYGSFSLNPLSLSVAGQSISTETVEFPLSWYQQVTLNAFENGSAATFSSSKQKVKVMPSSYLKIGTNVTATIPGLAIYDNFTDAGTSSTTYQSDGHTATATCIVDGSLTATSLGGFIQTSMSGGRVSFTNGSCSTCEVNSSSGSSFTTTVTYQTLAWTAHGYLSNETNDSTLLPAGGPYISAGAYWNASNAVTEATIDPPSGASSGNTAATFPLTGSLASTVGITATSYTWSVSGEGGSLSTTTGSTTTLSLTANSGSSDVTVTVTLRIVGSNGTTYTKTGSYVRTKQSSCLLPDALITMADGTQKEVKDIEQGDLVLVFNHETGQLDVAPITFNDHDEASLFTVLYLNFSNGKSVGVISEHGFFDLDTMRYEYIREDNYQEFIGHRFYTEEGDEAILTSVNVRAEYTECYSPTSFYHFDYFVEGMLSMPGGITGLFNIFEIGSDLKYDEEAYNRDIETYGLFTYEDLAPLGVTEIMFEAYAGKYLKVALGKGILTEEYLEYLIARYGGFTEEP